MKSLLLILILASSLAYASDDSVVNSPVDLTRENSRHFKAMNFNELPASEIFVRTKAVLDHFDVPEERSNQDVFDSLQMETSLPDLKKVLGILDPENELFRFIRITGDDMDVFQDRDGYSELDGHYVFSHDQSEYISQAIQNLKAAKNNPEDKPLLGLKVAIDPGHMNSGDWESRTGKYVKDKSGRKVSEALINLQTSLDLKEELEKLGATEIVTR
jgi:N-acetylmuramoyl-L-alanine amidase